MSELPKGWIEATIGEVIEPYMTIDPRHEPDSKFRYIDIGSIDNTKQIITEPKAFAGRDAPSRARRVVHSGDVLFSTVRTYLKNIAVVPPSLDGVLTSTGISVLRPSSAIESVYLFGWVRSELFVESMSKAQDGTLYPAVRDSDVSAGNIPLPPLAEQRRIVAKLNTLTGSTARAYAELEPIPVLIARYKQAILSEAFSGELSRDWKEKDPLKEEWSVRKLGSLLNDVVAGKNLRCDERPPNPDERGVLKVSAVTWGEFDPKATKTLPLTFDPPEKTRVRPGDLLISRANTLELVGAVVLVKSTPSNLFLSDKVLRLELEEDHKRWLLWFLRSPYGRRQIEKGATGNQLSMRNLSQAALSEILVPWPTPTERNEVVRRIEMAFAWLDRVTAEHKQAQRLLSRLDQAILAKAFRGGLVPQDPNDEPASVLLERVLTARVGAPKRGRMVRARGTSEIEISAIGSLTVVQKEQDMKTRKDVSPYHLSDLVKKSGGQIKADALWRASEMSIDEFYKLLRDEVAAKRLQESKDKASLVNAN